MEKTLWWAVGRTMGRIVVVVVAVVVVVSAIMVIILSTSTPTMAASLEDLVVIATTGCVVRITVQSVALTHHMVCQECLEIFLAIGGEEEGVDAGPELLEGEVGGGEEGAAGVGAVEFVEKAGLGEPELEGGEFRGQEGEDFENVRGWEENGVDAVDYAVAAELVEVLVGWMEE